MSSLGKQVGLLKPYVVSALGLALATALLVGLRSHASLTTVALVYVVVVMATALVSGSGPALMIAVLGTLALNYYFIPPIYTWVIHGSANWVAFTAFVITAITVGQLSSRERHTAEQAESRRVEIERLYGELQKVFVEASQAEALRNSEKLKGALLEAVTHDLRTPLTAIKASATTLMGGSAMNEEARHELLQVIDEEADRLNRFVEEMMELAQIEGGQLSLHRAPVPALEVVNAALDRCSLSLQNRRVEVALASNLPALRVDAAAIAAVLVELLDNAAKYSPEGSPMRIAAEEVTGGSVQLSVEDRGAGIPPELRERVFQKFFRASKARSKGFGMGLAIAKGIVEAHGGRIWVEPAPSGGSVFKFTVASQESET